ncbi:MAG: hypothetical protein OEZ34_10500 [Spirochaetia bacterium]|nr:hypothetical protein [Spirochaetia bacterium]
MKEFREENETLKLLVAELSLKKRLLKKTEHLFKDPEADISNLPLLKIWKS